MDAERHSAISRRIRSLIENCRDKEYRDSYIAGHARRFLAHQMRTLRGKLSQSEFSEVIGKQRTVVDRLEDPNYGKWTLQTLFDVAEKLNIAVLVRFVDIPTFFRLSEDMSDNAVRPEPYDEAKTQALIERPNDHTVIKPLNPMMDIFRGGEDGVPKYIGDDSQPITSAPRDAELVALLQ